MGEKEKLIKAAKIGTMQIIASISVITPVIIAMLQIITGEDVDTKMDRMLSFAKKTIQVLDKRLQRRRKDESLCVSFLCVASASSIICTA